MSGLMDDLDKRTDLVKKEMEERMAKEKAKEEEMKRKAKEDKEKHDLR